MVNSDLAKIYRSQEQELMDVTDVADYIADDILEIRRKQYLTDDGWDTTAYTLITGIGGPHVEFDTLYNINIYWGGDQYEGVTNEKSAKDTIDKIEEYLDDLFP